MRRRAAGWLAGLTLAWGCLLGGGRAVYAQAAGPSPLGQAVQLAPGSRSLGAILRELSRQSRLPLSYSSSLVPLTRRYAVRPGPPRPLGDVLRDVLGAAHLNYGLLDGQLVLWPARAAAPPGVLAATPQAATHAIRPPGHEPAAGGPTAPAAAPPSASERGRAATGLASGHGKPPTPRWAAGLALPPTKPVAASPAPGRRITGNARKIVALPKYSALTSHQTAGGRDAATTASGTLLAAAPNRAKQAKHTASPAAGAAGRQPGANSLAAEQSGNRAVAPLAARPVRLVVAGQPLPAGLPTLARVRAAEALPAPADAPRPTPGRPAGLYLHGEAWLSESLPVGITGKVGLARAYLVLGVAAGPFDHPAWGVGLGTAGRARGRFTPSLDLVEWFVPGDEHESVSLTQLRPQLTWQLRRQGRLALLAGPTLNLAAADNHGSPRGSFGQRQWLWLDNGEGRHSVRCWPGLQVGLRF